MCYLEFQRRGCTSFNTDGELVQFVLDGDPRAARYLVDRFTPLVFGILVREFRLNRSDAEDLYQESFLRLFEDDWRRLRMWRGDGGLAGYLVPIVRNLALEHLRRQNREPAAGGAELADFDRVFEDEPTVEEQAALEEKRRILRECVETLPGPQRELYRLRYEQGLKHREVAEALDMTTNAASVALFRLDRRLRVCFSNKT